MKHSHEYCVPFYQWKRKRTGKSNEELDKLVETSFYRFQHFVIHKIFWDTRNYFDRKKLEIKLFKYSLWAYLDLNEWGKPIFHSTKEEECYWIRSKKKLKEDFIKLFK